MDHDDLHPGGHDSLCRPVCCLGMAICDGDREDQRGMHRGRDREYLRGGGDMSMDLTNKVSRLPDYYDKTEGESNNWKILELSREAKQDFKDTLDGIREASDDRYLPACLYYTGLPEELQ